MRGGCAPSALLPWVGLPGPHPGFLSFHDERNQRRAGAVPLDPRGGHVVPPAALPHPPNRGVQPLTQTDLPLWVGGKMGLCFSPGYTGGHTSCCQSVARQGCHRGCLKVSVIATNTARAQGRGIKGGEAPFAGGPGTRRFLAYLCLLSLREKVGRGAGRSARSLRAWELCSHMGSAEGRSPSQRPRSCGAAGKR